MNKGKNYDTLFDNIRTYLNEEYKSKKNVKTNIITRENLIGIKAEVPQQRNFDDCGLYFLQYVEIFLMVSILKLRIFF